LTIFLTIFDYFAKSTFIDIFLIFQYILTIS